MSETVTIDQVWNTLLSSSSFDNGVPDGPMRTVFRELLEQSFTVLGPYLDKPATLANFVQAKVAVIRKAAEIEFARKMTAAMPAEAFPPGADISGFPELAQQYLADSLPGYEKAALDVVSLPPGGMTEEIAPFDAMLCRSLGRHPAATLDNARVDVTIAIDATGGSDMTIGRLLVLEPAAFLAQF